jgi:hypothetical protein
MPIVNLLKYKAIINCEVSACVRSLEIGHTSDSLEFLLGRDAPITTSNACADHGR